MQRRKGVLLDALGPKSDEYGEEAEKRRGSLVFFSRVEDDD